MVTMSRTHLWLCALVARPLSYCRITLWIPWHHAVGVMSSLSMDVGLVLEWETTFITNLQLSLKADSCPQTFGGWSGKVEDMSCHLMGCEGWG